MGEALLDLSSDSGSCGAMAGWGWVWMTAGWIAIVGFLAWVIRLGQSPRAGSGSEISALEVLAVRYANGEISEAEYDERLSVLGG